MQFVQPGNCANLGVSNPADYCNSNPYLATPCYVTGDPLGDSTNTSQSASTDAFVAFPYNDLATTNNDANVQKLAFNNQIGAVWGVTYQRTDQTLFTSAVLKRHSGFGELGIGGIYAIDYSNPASPTVTNWLDLNTLAGVDVGTEPADRDLSFVISDPSNDPTTFVQVGKIGIGDIDLSEDERTLYVMNLNNNGELLAIDVATKTLIGQYALPNPGCGDATDVHPWGISVYKGSVYVGLVCSGQVSGGGDLQFFILKLEGGSFSTFYNHSLIYDKGFVIGGGISNNTRCTDWLSWSGIWAATPVTDGVDQDVGSTIVCRPQPVLSGFVFDDDGSLILTFLDRTGHQTGHRNYPPTGTSTGNTPMVGGDLLRVYNNNGTLEMESNGTAGPNTTIGANNMQGPGGGEFYYTDNFNNHEEVSIGAVAIMRGSGFVAANIMDPFAVYSGGTALYSNTNGSSDDRIQLYESASGSSAGDGFFGKANGLGDLELVCDAAPIEIGNFVWLDTDGNGIQDPGEPGMDSIRVELYDATGTLIAFDTTDTNGQYYFSADGAGGQTWLTPGDALDYNSTYYIVVGNGGQFSAEELTFNDMQYTLTTDSTDSGDNRYAIDSDGTIASGVDSDFDGMPYVSIMTGNTGEVNHTYDFGFTQNSCETINSLISFREICSGALIDTLTVTSTFTNPDSIAFVYFTSAQTDSSVIYTGGMGIDTVQISGTNDTIRLLNVSGFTNAGLIPAP